MKIFNRGADNAKPAEPAKAAPAAPPPAAAPAPAPAAAATPDLTSIIDANVKEMSEKIARLATTIESEHAERNDFEAKLEMMEERMRKLSSLTEMISAQYNPFVGAAPSEREPLPAPEVGLAMPVQAAPAPGPAPGPQSGAIQIELQEAPMVAPPLELPPMPEPAPSPAPAPAPALAPAPPALALAPAPAPSEQDAGPARLWSIPSGFTANMTVLHWCDMLLKHAPSREALGDLLEYYHNLGWLGEPARDQMLAYASGLMRSDAKGSEWRADAWLHQLSLLYIEKLRALGGAPPGS